MPALGNVLVVAALVIAALLAYVLVGLDGWTYYRTPLRVRGYSAAHQILRPSGTAGRLFGVWGLALMAATLFYSLRKRSRRLQKVGSAKGWLEAHIFCGLVGPSLVTLHTSFKFNGIVSIAYWSMATVVLSGFVGRYLYVRIPKTIRGTELTLAELEERGAELKAELSGRRLPPLLLRRIEAFEEESLRAPRGGMLTGFLFGDLTLRLKLLSLRRQLRRTRPEAEALRPLFGLIRERAFLLRRIATLSFTRRAFELWHVFHKPFVYLMLVIAALHVALALYLGYGFGR